MPYHGLYAGTVVYVDDPLRNGRVKVKVPGILEFDRDQDGPWARLKGCGSNNDGVMSAPPVGCDVYVQFINGNPEQPVYERASPANPVIDGTETPEKFPEYESPDSHVMGIGPFRLAIDNQDGQRSARLKVVREVGGEEQDVAWLEFNFESNSAQLYATTALEIKAEGIVNIDGSVVQVRGRKVTPSNKAIN